MTPALSDHRHRESLPVDDVLEPDRWRVAESAHAAVVDGLTSAYRDRVSQGRRHPVEDFLFTYYSLRPSQLRRWYPGVGTALRDAPERTDWRFHQLTGDLVTLDRTGFMQARGEQVDFVRRLLSATSERVGQFGCFGLHEWAMVYRQDPERIRHSDWPLRLGADGTDDVVNAHQIRCTHFDAFRFFTQPARGRNLLQPTQQARVSNEQPGCLHVGMDLYKWAYKLLPAVPSDLLVECFLLARQIREVDMRASPYDLAELGYSPIAIETPDGKAEYVALQREFTTRAMPLRQRLLTVIDRLRPAD